MHLYTLNVSISGSGSVAGLGISCPDDCTEEIEEGTNVTLEAVPQAGHEFLYWESGAREQSPDNPLNFDMEDDAYLTAVFDCATPSPPFIQQPDPEAEWGQQYTISWGPVDFAESYRIQEANNPDFTDPTTINTTDTFSSFSHQVDIETIYFYRVLVVTSCTSSAYSDPAQVTVKPRNPYLVSVIVQGQGLVIGPGMDCPGDCEATYLHGDSVSLNAQAETGWAFIGWSGDISQEEANININAIDRNYSLTAGFGVPNPTIHVEPSELQFGEVSLAGAGKILDVVVKNYGIPPLVISDIRLSAGTPASFALIAETCRRGGFVYPDDCFIRIRFAPLVSGTAQGGLVISSNDPATQELEIPVEGKGMPEYLSLRIIGFEAEPDRGSAPLTSVLLWQFIGGQGPYTCDITSLGIEIGNIENCVSGDTAEIRLTDDGIYPVILEVTDDEDVTAEAELEIIVGNVDGDFDLPEVEWDIEPDDDYDGESEEASDIDIDRIEYEAEDIDYVDAEESDAEDDWFIDEETDDWRDHEEEWEIEPETDRATEVDNDTSAEIDEIETDRSKPSGGSGGSGVHNGGCRKTGPDNLVLLILLGILFVRRNPGARGSLKLGTW